MFSLPLSIFIFYLKFSKAGSLRYNLKGWKPSVHFRRLEVFGTISKAGSLCYNSVQVCTGYVDYGKNKLYERYLIRVKEVLEY